MKSNTVMQQPLDDFTMQLNLCDVDTVYHCMRVGKCAKMLLEEYIRLFHPEINYTPDMLLWAATVHDIGKHNIDPRILQKAARLSQEETEKTKLHVQYGDDILSQYRAAKNPVLRKLAHEVILYHHERADGKGYLNGLTAEDTPLSARIVALADCFDALIGARPYKPPLAVDAAIEMIKAGKCGAFSPDVLECLPVLRNA